MESKIDAQGEEEGQADHLPGHTSNHDVNANVGEVLVVGARGDTTTGSLEKEGDNVAGDEESSVCSCLEARDLFAVGDNNA